MPAPDDENLNAPAVPEGVERYRGPSELERERLKERSQEIMDEIDGDEPAPHNWTDDKFIPSDAYKDAGLVASTEEIIRGSYTHMEWHLGYAEVADPETADVLNKLAETGTSDQDHIIAFTGDDGTTAIYAVDFATPGGQSTTFVDEDGQHVTVPSP